MDYVMPFITVMYQLGKIDLVSLHTAATQLYHILISLSDLWQPLCDRLNISHYVTRNMGDDVTFPDTISHTLSYSATSEHNTSSGNVKQLPVMIYGSSFADVPF